MEKMPQALLKMLSHMVSVIQFFAIMFLTHSETAKENDFDVVLIDTAGRMQDNEVCNLFIRS